MRYVLLLLVAFCGSVHADTGLVVVKSAHNSRRPRTV